MVEGKTKSGFAYKIDERISQDWRVISAIAKAESKNASEQLKGTTDLVSLMLGSDEERFIKHIQDKNDGFVPITVVTEEIAEIISSLNSSKN